MSRAQYVLSVAFVLIGCVPSAHGQCASSEPASGNCAYPRAISGAVGHHVVLMDVQGATNTDRFCPVPSDVPVGNIVYFTVIPEVTGTVSVSSCHPMTMFDTVIEVGSSPEFCESGNYVACNDDDSSDICPANCYGRASQLSFYGYQGTRYLIRVGSYNDNYGDCPLCLVLILTIGSP